MKKTIMKSILTLILLAGFSLAFSQTPQLTYKMGNPRVIYSYNDTYGDYCQNLEFDIYFKCDQAGTKYKAIQVNCTIDETSFTDADYSPGDYGPAPAQIIYYNRIVNLNSGNLNLAIVSNQSHTNVTQSRYTEVPTTFGLLGTLRVRITNPNVLDNIHFITSSMNGQQIRKLFSSPYSQYYLNPNLYEGNNLDNLYVGRIFNPNSGWWQYGGTTPDAQYINWSTPVNTTVWEGTASITQADDNTAYFNHLNILNGATLNIDANKWVTVQGNLTNTGTAANLVVHSGGSLITQGTITGEGTLHSATSSSAWKLISPPVPGLTANIFNGFYLQQYNEATNTWSDIIAPTTPLAVGKGYALWGPSGTTYTGTFNTGNYNVNVTKNGPGFNLLGNPYPSGLEITDPSGWNTNLGAAKYVWNQGSGNYQTTVNFIPPAQGFFVLASNPASVTIPNTDREHVSTPLIKAGEANELKLFVEGNGYADEAFVKVVEGSTNFFDYAYDVPKMFGLAEAPQMYTIIPQGEFTQLTQNVFPSVQDNDVVPLHLKVGAETSYTLSADGIASFVEPVRVTLLDLKTGTSQVLNNNPVYSFTASPSDDPARFLLLFANTTGISHPALEGINIYAWNRTIMLNNAPNLQGDIVVYDLVGKELMRTPAQPGLNQLHVNMASAWYLVKFVSNQGSISQKVFIR